MATLEADFERKAREAFLDDAEEKDPGAALAAFAEANFREYAREHGYDIDHVWQDAEVTTTRSGDTIRTEIEWPALTALFEFGVSPHTISGNPILSFAWPSPPEGTRPEGAPEFVEAQEVDWGSVTGGIEEARAIRRAINQLRNRYR